MSIFATRLLFADDGGLETAPAPRIYRGSHVNPAADDPRGGWLELAEIPDHCHPDVRFRDDPKSAGGRPVPVEYLRLGLGRPAGGAPEDDTPRDGRSDDAGSDDAGSDQGGPDGAGAQTTVILDRTQVELLHAALTEWLAAR
ncbi:hypothetical protein ACIRST_16860 [Kitasatospora sp. NPDC101447]|uniref:hypothetical protein n=1 Tax=Kitasatospora sp. NPDC101447 TaxID=3364102 RepID=UPI00381BAB89